MGNIGRAPKVLVRITDPVIDYRATWSVEFRPPAGAVDTKMATWSGSGKVSRARFGTATSNRSGEWTGVAIREGLGSTVSHNFEAFLS